MGSESAEPPSAAIATSAADGFLQPTQVVLPAVPEQRMLTLEYPASIRAGDSDLVLLTLEVDAQGNLTPTAQIDGNVVQGEVISIPNVYDTHNIMAEARLDLAGVEVQPSEIVSETLLPGQKVTFRWSVLPENVGNYKGTVWFYLRYIPKDGSPDTRQALSAQLIEIDALALFGLKATFTRWLGVVGTAIGSVLGFPFAEDVLKWLWKRVRKAA